MILYPLIAALVIAADQITKYLVRSGMQPGGRIALLGKWLSLYYVRNTGTAFSMFAGNRWVTIVLTSVLIAACLIVIIREARGGSRVIAALITLVFAGGVSNLIDRLALGYVTDMISCWSFAVFNVADIAVTCGCLLTVLYIMTRPNEAAGGSDDETESEADTGADGETDGKSNEHPESEVD